MTMLAAVLFALAIISASASPQRFAFNATFGSHMVLQRAPAQAAVYGVGAAGASGLPGNPWIARLTGGRCECVSPQRCDA